MRRCAARVAVLSVLLVWSMGDFGEAGTIRHDRNDSLYTDLAASADFQAVGMFTIDGPISVASGTLIKPDWVTRADVFNAADYLCRQCLICVHRGKTIILPPDLRS